MTGMTERGGDMTTMARALLAEAQRLVEPLVVAGRVDSGAEMLLGLVGQSADAAGDPGLAAALADLSQAASALTALQDDDLDSWSELEAVADAARKATTALAALEHAVSDPGLAHRLEGLGVDLTGQLTGIYLRRFHSRLFRLVAVLTLISPAEFHAPQPPVMDGDTVVRRTWFRDELHFDRIDPLLNQPWPTLRAVYFPHDLASAADAHASAALLFPMIGALLDAVHLPWSFDRRELNPPPPVDITPTDPSADDGQADTGGFPDQGDLPDPPVDPDPVDLTPFYLGFVPRLTVRIPRLQADGSLAGTFLGVAVESWSAAHPGNTPGLVVELTGALDWTATSGDWAVAVASEGDVPAFVIGPKGLSLGQGVSGADASVTVTAARQPPAAGVAAFVLGSPDGSRLELGSVKAGLDLTLAASGLDLAIAVAASSGKLVIAPGDGDGFLAMILPSDGLTAPFDVGMIVSASRGVELNGGAGLQVSRPAHVSLGSVGSVDALVTSVTARGDGLHVGVGAGLTLHLGPLDISVDHVGISSTVAFPHGGGDLGPLDVGDRIRRSDRARPDGGCGAGDGWRGAGVRPRPRILRGRDAAAVRGDRGACGRALDDRAVAAIRCWCWCRRSSRRCSSGWGSCWSGSAACWGSTGPSPSRRCARGSRRALWARCSRRPIRRPTRRSWWRAWPGCSRRRRGGTCSRRPRGSCGARRR